MPRPIGDKTYEEWVEIIYYLYYKMDYPKKMILSWFPGTKLTEQVFKAIVTRLKAERPDDEYIQMKAKASPKRQRETMADRIFNYLNFRGTEQDS